jgi:hypothetical protein
MPNIYSQFLDLLPRQAISICSVVSEDAAAGVTDALTMEGQPIRLIGANGRAAGAKVLVEGRRVLGDAPDLPGQVLEV